MFISTLKRLSSLHSIINRMFQGPMKFSSIVILINSQEHSFDDYSLQSSLSLSTSHSLQVGHHILVLFSSNKLSSALSNWKDFKQLFEESTFWTKKITCIDTKIVLPLPMLTQNGILHNRLINKNTKQVICFFKVVFHIF